MEEDELVPKASDYWLLQINAWSSSLKACVNCPHQSSNASKMIPSGHLPFDGQNSVNYLSRLNAEIDTGFNPL